MEPTLHARGPHARIAARQEVVAIVEMLAERDAAPETDAELLADYAAVLRAQRALRLATARLERSLERHQALTR